MSVGDAVSVFDARRSRWCRGTIKGLGRTVLVATSTFWAFVPLAPDWVRPIRVLA